MSERTDQVAEPAPIPDDLKELYQNAQLSDAYQVGHPEEEVPEEAISRARSWLHVHGIRTCGTMDASALPLVTAAFGLDVARLCLEAVNSAGTDGPGGVPSGQP